MIGGGWGRGRREEDAGPGKGGDPVRGGPGWDTRAVWACSVVIVSHPVDSCFVVEMSVCDRGVLPQTSGAKL